MFKSISFHPKFAAVLDLLINLIMLWRVRQFHSWGMVAVWFIFRLAVWGIFMWLVYYPAEMKKIKHWLSLAVMTIGSLSFLLFIEWSPAWYLFAALFCFFSFFSFWLLPSSNVSLATFLKPHLRWRFVMSVIGLAGIFAAAAAITEFQILPGTSRWIWLVLAATFSAFIAGWWWLEYGIKKDKRFWLWIIFWFGLILELLWVIGFLSLGYLVNSLVLIWCWYVVWLLIRFNLSAEGINWRKQAWFLTFNTFLFFLFLIFVVRWK